MIRAAIVEDDPRDRDMLRQYLRQYEEESGERFQVALFSDGVELVEGYRPDYDVILMDIEMALMDGMEAARQIRRVDGEVVILFITNAPQYVTQGYTVDALDYVLKPITYFSFSQKMGRALARRRLRRRQFLMVPVRGGARKVDAAQIDYIEVRDHELVYHLGEDALSVKGTLSDVEQGMERGTFFRCGASYLVNLERVERVEDDRALVGRTWLPVSRARRKAFLDALNNYMNEVSL